MKQEKLGSRSNILDEERYSILARIVQRITKRGNLPPPPIQKI